MGCKKFTRYFDWHIRSQERFEDLGTKRPIKLKCLECVWAEFIWLKTGSVVLILWTLKGTSKFQRKETTYFPVAEKQSAYQKRIFLHVICQLHFRTEAYRNMYNPGLSLPYSYLTVNLTSSLRYIIEAAWLRNEIHWLMKIVSKQHQIRRHKEALTVAAVCSFDLAIGLHLFQYIH